MTRRVVIRAALIVSTTLRRTQDRPPFQSDVPAEELAQRDLYVAS